MRVNSLLCLLFVVCGAIAQDLNYTGNGDTAQLVNWKADSLFISKTFNFSNRENKMIAFLWDDTSQAGRKLDSCAAEIGIQYGYPCRNLMGTLDTGWTNIIPLDSCQRDSTKMYNGKTARGGVKWTLDANDLPVRPHGAIDTSMGTSSSQMSVSFQPYWYPCCRFTVKGLPGNDKSTFLRAKLIFQQRVYSSVRNQ